jgi:FkbM family methyltransferase
MSRLLQKLRLLARDGLNCALAPCGLEITNRPQLEELRALVRFGGRSRSQYGQDIFVLSELGFPRNGFFVEFGAYDGVTFSNTHLLEKELGWRGILAEPARCCHADLAANRSCMIETGCVWRESDAKLSFQEEQRAFLSKLGSHDVGAQAKPADRGPAAVYEVQTISLNDLLAKYDAPHWIDYLSIDTEGSEFDILNAFDFDAHIFRTITCEHNYNHATRAAIHDLLSRHGYVRRYQHYSMCDDWYVFAN